MSNEKELKLGFMSTQDLADWMGVSYKTLRLSREKKLIELKEFCDFEEVYGGIDVSYIRRPVYVKNSQRIREIYDKGFEEMKMPLDTVSNINKKIYDKYHNKMTTLKSADSGYHYAIEARNAHYGIPFKQHGSKGECYYLWCKVQVQDKETYYIQFNEEEEAIKKKLLKKYFGTNEEKDLLIAEMVNNREITKEEAYDLMTEYRNLNSAGFLTFVNELSEAIGAKVVKATKFEDVIYFEEELKELIK